MAPLKQILVYSLVAFLMAARAYAFPTEEQVRSHLHSGMTPKEVVALFGKPVSGVAETCVNCTFRYVAPFGMLNVEREGYIGFVIDFRDGKASEWRIIKGYPSFAPPMMPWSVKIWVWLLPISLVLGILSKVFMRRTPVAFAVIPDVVKAFEAGEISTA